MLILALLKLISVMNNVSIACDGTLCNSINFYFYLMYIFSFNFVCFQTHFVSILFSYVIVCFFTLILLIY